MNEKTDVTSARSHRKAGAKSTTGWKQHLQEKMANEDQEGISLWCPDLSLQELEREYSNEGSGGTSKLLFHGRTSFYVMYPCLEHTETGFGMPNDAEIK